MEKEAVFWTQLQLRVWKGDSLAAPLRNSPFGAWAEHGASAQARSGPSGPVLPLPLSGRDPAVGPHTIL